MKDTINPKEMPRILRVMQALRGTMTAKQLAEHMGLSGPDDKIDGCRLRHVMARIAKLGGFECSNAKSGGVGRPEVQYSLNAYGEAMIHQFQAQLTGPPAAAVAPLTRREEPVAAPAPAVTPPVPTVPTGPARSSLVPLKTFGGTAVATRDPRTPAVIPKPTTESKTMPPPPAAKKPDPKPVTPPAVSAPPAPVATPAPVPVPAPKPAPITDITTRIARPGLPAEVAETVEVARSVRAVAEATRIGALEEIVAKLESELIATRNEMTSMRAAFLGIAQAINHGLKGAMSDGRDT